MTIQELGSLGELIAAVATVATLAYLAVQIRRSDNTARAQARQTLIDTWASRNWDLARDSRMLHAFSAGLARWPDISNEEKTTFDTGMGAYLANIQNGLLLRDSGLLDDEVLDRTADYMVVCITSPGGRQWWADTANAWPQVRAYLDRRLASDDTVVASAEESMPHFVGLADGSNAAASDGERANR